jgi:phosphatidylcholine synthase
VTGVLQAWLVHLYTASGAVMGLLAAANIFESNYTRALAWLFAATVVDATDGVLARAARVSERLPWFDGALLDNLVDYITYVFVPALLVWQALLVPDAWSIPLCSLMLISSAYGFSRDDAKTDDGLFTGFPSYWNVVALYLYVAHWPQSVNVLILTGLGVLVFVPIRYVYPTRTPFLRPLTLVLAACWAVALLVMIRHAANVSRPLLWVSLVFPAYYVLLSIAVSVRRRRARDREP